MELKCVLVKDWMQKPYWFQPMKCQTLPPAQFQRRKMVAVMAYRRTLLRRIRSSPLPRAPSSVTRDVSLPETVIFARSFAVLTENDGRVPRETALQRLTETSQRIWRLRAAVNLAEQSLPFDKGTRFYSRRVAEALEQSNYNRAWGIMQTLHQRYPHKVMLYPYTYNLLLRHLCKLQKTLSNANLSRILALLDVMIAHGCADQTSFQVAMAACSRARDLPRAVHVLEKMKEYGRTPDERIYGFLINCCARKQGLVKTAERYFAEMLSEGVKPTVIAVNAMLRVFARDAGRSMEIMEIVQRARDEFHVTPNTVTTRTVVYYLLCEGDVGGAVEFLRSVDKECSDGKAVKLPVRRPVVNAAVDACRQRRDWSLAEYALTLLARTDEDEYSTDIANDRRDSAVLEQLIGKRDGFSASVVWALDECDWSRVARPQQEAFLLNQSRKQSVARALERMQARKARSKADQFMERLSLKLEGKLRVLDEMIEAKSADAADFNAVLGLCGRQGELADARGVLSKMKLYAKTLPECEPTTWSYNALLNACAVRGDVHQIESIVNEMMENALQPDAVTMNTVIKAHDVNLKLTAAESAQTRLNTVMQALSFFEWCTEDLKLDAGAATYFMLFHLFASYLARPDESDTSVNNGGDGRGNGVAGDEELSQEGELMEWMTEFITTTCRDAPLASLDIRVFNKAFDYYQRLGAVDESFALFTLMKKRGIEPDDATIGLMFATCASQQEFHVGLNFLDHLMAVDGYKPSLKVLNGAMQLCAHSKNPDGALDLFRAIETSGVFEPTVESYEPVVYAYARVGNLSRAWDMANEMKEKLGRVTVGIYDRILLACAEASLPGRALEVLSVMQHTRGLNPTVISYNTALEAFVRAGERAAWWRKNRMNWEGEDEDAECDDEASDEDFDAALDELEERGPDDDGSKEAQSTGSSKATTEDFEREQREKAAWARASIVGLLEEMQRSGVNPDSTTYERAIAACSVNEDNEGVVAIFDRLVHRKRGEHGAVLENDRVSASSFSAYLAACACLQYSDRVVEGPTLLHNWHQATGLVPPVFVVTQLVDALEGAGEWRRAVRILPEMQTLFGAPPSVAVFNRVMHMCNHEGEHHLVGQIFATMQDAAAYRVYPDAESYIQWIYAEEQRENWAAATDLFVEMQKKCPSEEISPSQLQKIALGQYRLRQSSQ
jgi:pentatricopeptide repeat protein